MSTLRALSLPGGLKPSGFLSDLKYDLPASLVVFLVAVPLSLGIAVASGAPVAAGLTAAIVGGLVAGLLGGSALQVSGPAAGMVVLVAGLIAEFSWPVVCAITLCAGLVQVILGFSRVGKLALGISPAVVHGMLAGIGLTIVLGQIHVILGFKAHTSPIENLRTLPGDLVSDHVWETAVGLATIAVLLLWPRIPVVAKRVPSQLVAIALVTLVSVLAGLDVTRVNMPDTALAVALAPQLPDGAWAAFAIGVVSVALLASVESLLSAVAVDKMHDRPRANLNRELVGQGAANMASGALGGLPVTGVIVRSSTNVHAGAHTRAAAVLHGVWVLLFVALLGGLIEMIPLAALAGLLCHVGVKLMDVGHIRTAARHGDLPVYVVTLGGVLLTDLMIGVLLGIGVALLLTVRRMMWSAVHAEQDGDVWRVKIEGALSFLSTPRLASVLGKIPAGQTVRMEFIVDYLDHTAYEYIANWQGGYERGGGTVVVEEIGHPWLKTSHEGQPTVHRKNAHGAAPRFLAPWSDWQAPEHAQSGPGANPSLLRGIEQYQRHVAPLVQQTMSGLATGQSPRTLLITCGDSRIVPNLITTSGPGDLFTIRNIGNLVPSADTHTPRAGDTSVGAAIEYAVKVLEVEDIVVCGHSGCGAMGALVNGTPEGAEHLTSWLSHGVPSVQRMTQLDHERTDNDGSDDENKADQQNKVDRLARLNVAQQLDHLRSYDVVVEAEDEGRLKLVAMFFDIPTAQVHILDTDGADLQPVG